MEPSRELGAATSSGVSVKQKLCSLLAFIAYSGPSLADVSQRLSAIYDQADEVIVAAVSRGRRISRQTEGGLPSPVGVGTG